ncbi:ABC transporter ATP-binding protein [Micromonospora sp. NBC_01813]|uniref:ABC transporter ATP-binding protein n=1 Tax=Micromonospora sp. NBC_01813 TaxID=2975988 RepID=UPI002DD7AC77|nr:ABC transporter ATP-binding protein [Micromonospora sp. NBC_01813]WSA12443.1 ABC transporter ATP-binding protein/permease [Micromonospora sp. NBC_01813]
MRYLWWLVRSQPWRVLRGSLLSTLWMTGLAGRPYLVARAIDDGLRPGRWDVLLWWVAAIVVAGVAISVVGVLRHRTMTFVREDATARSAAVLLRQLARIGAVLPRRLAAGEVATVGGTDISHTSHVLTLTGPGVGAIIAYGVVAVLLWMVSPALAACILIGVPVIALLLGPMVRRLDRAEQTYRREQGQLTARAGDIVAGLRVLAGVGGRALFARRYVDHSQRLRTHGYRVAAVNSWLEALTVTAPGLFLAAVVWLSARMAVGGEISIGELVAVYGYVAALTVPVWFLQEGSYQLIRGRVAARRIVELLRLTPDPFTDDPAEGRAGPPGPADLSDPDSGLTVPAGRMVGVAADDPTTAVALADRLGRYRRSEVTWGGVPLSAVRLDEVRARILVADHDAYLFAGTLREILQAPASGQAPAPASAAAAEQRIRAAVGVASADDVVTALPDGLATPIGSRARTLSGGQRQRVRLARALLAEPEVLILIDPTSAVDAHTEARIAARVHAARAGRTTVLISTSPLLLAAADTVAHLHGGQVVSVGTHAALLADDPGYRALVARGDGDLADDALPSGAPSRAPR